MDPSILIVDDDPDFAVLLEDALRRAGFANISVELDAVAAVGKFENGGDFDVALIDMHMPDMDGMQVLQAIKASHPSTECIMVTAVNEARVAVACLRKGAYDYLVKPVPPDDLVIALNRTLERKRLLDILDIEKGRVAPPLKNPRPFVPIVTRSQKMFRVLKAAELHAASDVPVLITGESGTGKELLARAIHGASPRNQAPFTPVNMASLGDGLFEAEFFGHTRGAFTGAEKQRAGFLKATHPGSLFLDEIGVLPLSLQGKLLRVLQDGEYTRLGSSRRQSVDVRFIAATNEDLDVLLAQKKFRKDLYYRIRGGWLHLPPLRERRGDIPLLTEHFLKEYCHPRRRCRMNDQAMCLLAEYDFPGNVRELRAILQSTVNLAQGRTIVAEFLPREVKRSHGRKVCQAPGAAAPLCLADVEKQHILSIYQQTGHNKSQSARLLEIGLNTLRRKLRAYGVE